MIQVNGEEIKSFKFSGGEIQVNTHWRHIPVHVKATLRDSDDIMTLILAVNALRANFCTIEQLEIPYIPYARQDRVCASGEAFSIKAMAEIINSLKANKVIGWDVHSDVTSALINNFIEYPQVDFIGWDIELERILRDKSVWICSPDAGALKKIHRIQKVLKSDRLLTASKERDAETGNILSTNVDCVGSPQKVIILDDICDGGRTFIEIAKVLKARGAKKIYLYVTHGIFSKGFEVFDGLIDHIWTTDSFCTKANNKLTIIRRKDV